MGSPLTGFDWHVYDPHLLVTSSLDTTCTVWDVTGGQRLTQWRAHDQEVLDVSFANQPHAAHLLSSVSADGSLRLFDLRCLDHSTILYKHPSPLLRVAWHPTNPTYLATLPSVSSCIHVLDLRRPQQVMLTSNPTLNQETSSSSSSSSSHSINAIHWTFSYLCSVSEEGSVHFHFPPFSSSSSFSSSIHSTPSSQDPMETLSPSLRFSSQLTPPPPPLPLSYLPQKTFPSPLENLHGSIVYPWIGVVSQDCQVHVLSFK